MVRLEQVGRVRARIMYNAGIRKIEDIRKPGSLQKLERLFGREIAEKIYGQVSETLPENLRMQDLPGNAENRR